MPATNLKVSLLTMTPDAEALIYSAMRQCYSPDDVADIFKEASGEEVTIYPCVQNNLIKKVLESSHESPSEHVSFSFAISGVSRALSHQLVRHRIASYSQQSQRYVKADDFEYVVPPSMADDAQYASFMSAAATLYKSMVARGIPALDARFVLPNACATKLVVTMNCRSLLHFFEERLCQRAQWEIRALAKAMYDICVERLPVVFAGRGAKCVKAGHCTEHQSCGRMPKRAVGGE